MSSCTGVAIGDVASAPCVTGFPIRRTSTTTPPVRQLNHCVRAAVAWHVEWHLSASEDMPLCMPVEAQASGRKQFLFDQELGVLVEQIVGGSDGRHFAIL